MKLPKSSNKVAYTRSLLKLVTAYSDLPGYIVAGSKYLIEGSSLITIDNGDILVNVYNESYVYIGTLSISHFINPEL